MKTVHKITLLLHKLCNQKSFATSTTGFIRLNFIGLLTLFLLLLLPFQRAEANTSFDVNNTNQMNVTFGPGNDGLNYINFKVMVLEQDGIDDGMRYFYLYFTDENGVDNRILYMHNLDLKHDGSPLDAFITYNSVTNGYISGYSYTTSGTQTQANFTWYYPQRLIGKSIKLKMSFVWDIDLDGTGDVLTTYYKTMTASPYSPTTPTLSFTPKKDGTFMFNWSGAQTSLLSKFVVYSDASCTNKIDSVNVAAASGSYNIKLPNVDIKSAYTFYVKQIYIPANPISPTNTKRYESAAITVTNPGYQYPNNIVSTYSAGKQTIDLSWSAGNPTGNSVTYYVKRGATVVASGISALNFTDFSSPAVLTNWSNYNYTVYAVPTGMTSADSIPNLKSNFTVSTSPIPPNFKDFKLVPHPTNGNIQPYMEVNWDTNQWVPLNVVKLYHRASTSVNYTLVGTMAPGISTYSDNTVTDNSKHFYKLEVNVFGQIYSQIDSETVVKKVAFKSIKASKNTISDRIQLT